MSQWVLKGFVGRKTKSTQNLTDSQTLPSLQYGLKSTKLYYFVLKMQCFVAFGMNFKSKLNTIRKTTCSIFINQMFHMVSNDKLFSSLLMCLYSKLTVHQCMLSRTETNATLVANHTSCPLSSEIMTVCEHLHDSM